MRAASRGLVVAAVLLGSSAHAADYDLHVEGVRVAALGTKRLGFSGMRQIFGTSDLVAVCYGVGDDRLALFARIGRDSFAAMNGHARDITGEATIEWLGRRVIAEDHGVRSEIGNTLGRLIREGLAACGDRATAR